MHWSRLKRKNDLHYNDKCWGKCETEGCEGVSGRKGICEKCQQYNTNLERRLSGYKKQFERTEKCRYSKSKRAAKDRGMEFTLTLQQATELTIDRKCHYCNGELPSTTIGLDRMNNENGYTLENCVPCCTVCNQIKSNLFTYEEFLEISKQPAYKKMRQRNNKFTYKNKK